jgi:hypothetical protein
LWNSSLLGAAGCGRVGASFFAVSTFSPSSTSLSRGIRSRSRGNCSVSSSWRKRVERIMREQGLAGAYLRRAGSSGSTRQNPSHTAAPDLVERDFASSPRAGSGWPI